MLRISASNVAAAIGEHKYKSKEAAMYQMIETNYQWRSLVHNVKQSLGLKTLDDLTLEAIQKNANLVQTLEDNIQKSLDGPVVEIVEQSQKQFEGMLDGPHKELVASALAQTIQTERGIRNEVNVLDLYEQETGSTVTERNTKTVKKVQKCPVRNVSFTLVGIIDGLAQNKIIDAKERKRKWTVVPNQDLIQLRAQMDLQDMPEAELVERFPDGTRRNTVIQRDSEEWNRILELLCDTAQEVYDIVDDPSKLQNLIQQFTLS